MNDAQESKERDRIIAQNESASHTRNDIRLAVCAIGAAIVIAAAVFGWVLAR